MKIPYFNPSLGEDEIKAAAAVIKSGWLTTGSVASEFERSFLEAIECDGYALSVNSATSALHLALDAAGIGKGDEVIVPSLTFTSTAEVVRYVNATPIFADCNSNDLCINMDHTKRLISSRTKAIIPVHFGGFPAQIKALKNLAKEFNIKIIEDAAHAFPTKTEGAFVGNHGLTATCFSFYANKTITTGEGGMLVTKSKAIYERAKSMRLHGINRDVFDRFTKIGSTTDYDVIAPGFKYNLTDLACSIGFVQLKKAQFFREKRQLIADLYSESLAGLPLKLPAKTSSEDLHSWHLYPIVLNDSIKEKREQIVKFLKSNGVGTSLHYKPLHKMTYWKEKFDCKEENFPNSNAYYSGCISLPIYPDLSEQEVNYIISLLKKSITSL